MNRALAIAKRDFASYFLTPTGYIVMALFLTVSGIFFLVGFQQGSTASMRPVFQFGTWMLLFIGPAISMRMISEELRVGTIEMLMTSPVAEWQVILGKFIAGAGFLLIMLAPTLVYVIGLEIYGRPDYGELACGYLGVFLAGMAYIACGLFASTLSASQVVAFLLALFFWLLLGVGAKMVPQYTSGMWPDLAVALDPDLRLRDFSIGLIDTSNIVYFLSIVIVFLGAAVKSLETRRWQ